MDMDSDHSSYSEDSVQTPSVEMDSSDSSDSEDCVQVTANDILRNKEYVKSWPHTNGDMQLIENIITTLKTSKKTKTKVKKQYIELISTFEEYKKTGNIPSAILTENINKAKMLLDKYSTDFVSMGPREMFAACLHVNMFSEMVHDRSAAVETFGHTFKVNSFLHALKDSQNGPAEDEYSSTVFANSVSKKQSEVVHTVPSIISMMGLADVEALANRAFEILRKESAKKKRAPRKRKYEESNATIYTVVNTRAEKRRTEDNSARNIASDILKILEIYYMQNNIPLGLYNFTMDKECFAIMIKYIFYLSLLVRDGSASIRADPNKSLVVKPETPPSRAKGAPKFPRKTFILSINARQWRALSQASQGEDIITAYKIAHTDFLQEDDPMTGPSDTEEEPCSSRQAAMRDQQNTFE